MREFITKKDIGRKPLELSEADEKGVDETIEKALSLDTHGLAELRERIQRHDGLIRIFVHPFFNSESRINPGWRGSEPAFDFVEKGALRHIASAFDERTAPLFLLEEESFLKDARHKIEKNTLLAATGIFIIPTSVESGYIDAQLSNRVLSGSDWHAKATEEEMLRRQKSLEDERERLTEMPPADAKRTFVERSVKKAEQKLGAPLLAKEVPASNHLMAILLKGLNVKKIVVGGMYIKDEPDKLYGCVGPIIMTAKEQGITVTLSKYHTDWRGLNIRGVRQ